LHLEPSDKRLKKWWKEADLDDNGSIDLNEYILILGSHILERRREAEIRCAWRRRIDSDMSGKVDKLELLPVFEFFTAYA